MSLFLVESTLTEVSYKRSNLKALVESVHGTEGAGVIEVQVAKDFQSCIFYC